MPFVIGKDQSKVHRVTCGNCAAINEYTKGEIRVLWSGKDYSGGADGAKGFACAGCGKDIITERW